MASDMKRLTFAPYDAKATKDEDKPSAVAFDMLRVALKTSAAKPDAPEEPGSWERTAKLHLFFSRGEAKVVVPTGQFRLNQSTGESDEITAQIITLDPSGYTAVLPNDTLALLRSIWKEWMKTNGTRALALRIMLTNEFLAECVTDASDESAVKSGAVKEPEVLGKPNA